MGNRMEPEELTKVQLRLLLEHLNLPTFGKTKLDLITTLQFATISEEKLEKAIEELVGSDLKIPCKKSRKKSIPSQGETSGTLNDGKNSENVLDKIGGNDSLPDTRDAFFAPFKSDFQKYQWYLNNPPKRFSQNTYNKRRYYEFRLAAYYLAREFSGLAIIEKVAIMGSIARSLTKEPPHFKRSGPLEWHYSKDLDLAIWFNAPVNREVLREVQKKRAHGLTHLASEMKITFAHHQVEIFCLNLANEYLGRLCQFKECPKSNKQECLVVNCGIIPLLQQHQDFRFNPQSLGSDQIIEIYRKPEPSTP